MDLSEQHIVNCANSANGMYSIGCSGGYPEDGLRMANTFQLTTEAALPYGGYTGDLLASQVRNPTMCRASVCHGSCFLHVLHEQPHLQSETAASQMRKHRLVECCILDESLVHHVTHTQGLRTLTLKPAHPTHFVLCDLRCIQAPAQPGALWHQPPLFRLLVPHHTSMYLPTLSLV